MSHVFGRGGADAPVVARARGCRIWDTGGRSYLDASGGAIVVGVGHGVAAVADAVAAQARQVAYAHGTVFRSAVVEEYADALAPLLPVDDPRVYPVSGGSEAVETVLKMARAYHLARGEDRHVVVARDGAYHGSTRGALDISGRAGLRAPYLPWLGQAQRVPGPYEYRCPFPDRHPGGCAAAHADALAAVCARTPVAAFVAEPVAGAALGACVPPEEYWPRIAQVCRRYGVLLVADEVMTGFGRTGAWFGLEHWGVRADLLAAGKGAGSGYWPLGLAVASGRVHAALAEGGFTHGFTYSHHVVGAAAGLAVLRELRDRDLVAASAARGAALAARLGEAVGGHRYVGDVRGRGLLVGVEFVADRRTAAPFPRAARVAERVVAAARGAGVLVYPGTGCADGTDGDLIVLGPPLCVTDDELTEIVAGVAAALATLD
ncbi:adenosylmethionine-8-amino-7-oxononanoate aminotransferase [Pilimelia terevasa]|uniref:Adenosylmethionine-8-amino-7-oxononanoate aminotransferase n=1 Tax=Pilimelia terevasa TaxID=53372 RepID=A0A8J3FKG7_9ACTN|nr:aminotransferase class III-fold pyridoxal phosphate-dependent enzyme [Pilimelia terevasa]GGK40077.1 adenosylmethionine-8-amino-7-oxononanoate aminotransferase [Pilimelia terevasa]